MDKIDKEIKQRMKKDVYISQNAEKIFSNYIKGEFSMEENNIKNKVIKKSMKIKKIIAAISMLALLGGGQIYASTQGYGNVFFLIKYIVTGQKVEITGKDDLLSDRDITISYEPIQLTENIKMQVRNLQIKNNKAKLFIAIEEKPIETDKDIVPFNYKVYNSSNDLICEQKNNRVGDTSGYTDELLLKKFSEKDSSIKLEVYKANKDKLSTIYINLNTREVNVEGEKEAIKKISEIELKEFASYIAAFDSKIKNEQNEDYKITLAMYMMDKNKSKDKYKLTEINNMLESLGYEKIINNYKSNMYKVVKSEEEMFIKVIKRIEINLATITNINDISYSSGLYVAKYNYFLLDGKNSFDVDYNKIDNNKAILYFKLNSDNTYSKFKVIKFEKDETDSNNEQYSINKENENDEEKLQNDIIDNSSEESKNEEKDNTYLDNEYGNIIDEKQIKDVCQEIKTYIDNNQKDIKANNRFVTTSVEKTADGRVTSKVSAEGINIFNVILDRIEGNIVKVERMSSYDKVNYEVQNKQLSGAPKTIQFAYEDIDKENSAMHSDMYVRWNINTPKDITFSWWDTTNTQESRTNIKFTLNTNAEKIMKEIERVFSVYPSVR